MQTYVISAVFPDKENISSRNPIVNNPLRSSVTRIAESGVCFDEAMRFERKTLVIQ